MASTRKTFLICLSNEGYSASLERRKIYEALPDADADAMDQVRVIDESGEDYLYPANWFREIDLPPALKRAVIAAE